MDIKFVKNPISRKELLDLAREGFGDMVKAAVDIKQGVMAVGVELHADGEVFLVENCGSERKDIWGINIYPEKPADQMVEFDSMINIKPAHNNRSRGIEDPQTQERVRKTAAGLIAD